MWITRFDSEKAEIWNDQNFPDADFLTLFDREEFLQILSNKDLDLLFDSRLATVIWIKATSSYQLRNIQTLINFSVIREPFCINVAP